MSFWEMKEMIGLMVLMARIGCMEDWAMILFTAQMVMIISKEMVAMTN